jgi:hypothetical protein
MPPTRPTTSLDSGYLSIDHYMILMFFIADLLHRLLDLVAFKLVSGTGISIPSPCVALA